MHQGLNQEKQHHYLVLELELGHENGHNLVLEPGMGLENGKLILELGLGLEHDDDDDGGDDHVPGRCIW